MSEEEEEGDEEVGEGWLYRSGRILCRPARQNTHVISQEQLQHLGHSSSTTCITTRSRGQGGDGLNQQEHPGQVSSPWEVTRHRCCSTRTKHTHSHTQRRAQAIFEPNRARPRCQNGTCLRAGVETPPAISPTPAIVPTLVLGCVMSKRIP